MHRILNDLVDPSVGTLREIAVACGIQIDLTARPLSDPRAAAAARALLEGGYEPPSNPLFAGSFTEGIVRYAAPIQIVLDCVAQGGALGNDAIEEAMSW